MKNFYLVGLASFLAVVTQANATQPCAPFEAFSIPFQGTNMASSAILSKFYTEGHDLALDPRFLASVALAVTHGGSAGVCIAVGNPFFFGVSAMDCHPYGTFSDAIVGETAYVGTHYIADNRTDLFDIANRYDIHPPEMPSFVPFIAKRFEELFGEQHQPVLYSSGCCGDCNHDGDVEVGELIKAVLIALCDFPGPDPCCEVNDMPICPVPRLGMCPAANADADGGGKVLIHDLIRNISSAIFPGPSGQCPSP